MSLFPITYYSLTALVNCIGSVAIGVFVLMRGKNQPAAKMFALLVLSVVIWSSSYFMWQISDNAGSALFWSKGLMFGAIFISLTYLHFILAFLNLANQKKRFLLFSYLLFSAFFVANFNNLLITKMEKNAFFEFWPKPGPLFHPFLACWLIYASYGMYLLARKARTSTGLTKLQAKYLIIGMLIGYGGGATNYLLWYNIPIPPIGNGLVVFNIFIIAYTILRHGLLNIKVISTEILVGSLSLILLINLSLSESGSALFLNLMILLLTIFGGIALIKSVMAEIQVKEKLQLAYEDLKKLDEAKSEFISIASHQLRTPLSAIKGYISMILEGDYGSLEEKAKKPLTNVYESNERLIRLVNDLLNLSRIESGRIELHKESVSLPDLLKSVVEVFQNRAKEKGLYLKLKKPKQKIPEVNIDKEKFSQVIYNIIDNAIRYTHQGGITIQTELSQSKQDKIVINIKDTGEGIDQHDLKELFQSFSRGATGNQYWTEGMGLGLCIAQKFARLHDGRIWVESEGKNQGAIFYIELPV